MTRASVTNRAGSTPDSPAPGGLPLVAGSPASAGVAISTRRRQPDVVGAVAPPLAFAMPDAAPLEGLSTPRGSAGPDRVIADQQPVPAQPPTTYQRSTQQPPLESLAPRVETERDPRIPFSSPESMSHWASMSQELHGRHTDPHRPILTSEGPAGRSAGTRAYPEGQLPSAGQPSDAVRDTAGSPIWAAGSTARTSDWAPPATKPATVPPGGIRFDTATPSAVFGQLPARPGAKSLGTMCRGLGWGLVASMVTGCLGAWVSVPALLAGWYFTWRHPLARHRLMRAYGIATGLVLIISVIGSPTRGGWAQLSWAAWMANLGLLAAAFLIIDRTLTPAPRNRTGQGTGPDKPPQNPQNRQSTHHGQDTWTGQNPAGLNGRPPQNWQNPRGPQR